MFQRAVWLRLAVWLVLAAGAAPAPAATLLLEADTDQVNLIPHTDYLRDTSNALDLDQVRAEPVRDQFRPSTWTEAPNFGFTADTHWFRCRLESRAPMRATWYVVVNRLRLDWVSFHLAASNRPVHSLELGNMIPDAPREVHARPFVFPVTLDPGESADLYMAFASEAALWLPVSLRNPERFWLHLVRQEQWSMLFFGYMLALSIVAAFMAVAARDKAYLFYTLTTLTLTLFFFTYMQFPTLFHLPGAAYWGRKGCMLLGGLASSMFIFYTRHFLGLPRNAPRLDRILKATCAVGLILSVGTQPFRYAVIAPIITLQSQVFLAIGFIVSILFMIRGHRTAILYLVAWAIFLVTMILRCAVSFGWAPSSWHDDFIGQWSSMLGYTLFLLALAVRIRQMEREKLEAQAQLLAAQQAATRELASKVADRTAGLTQAKTEAEQARQAMSRFLINVVHDIRAPVNAVFALAQALWLESEKLKLPELYCQFLNRVRDGGDALSQMLANLFDLSQLELGRPPVRRETFPLDDWVREVRPILDLVADHRGVILRWDVDTPGQTLSSDRVRLSQILMNLAQNALKFTPAGKVVTLRLGAASGWFTLAVQDEGPGIPPAKQAALWNRDIQFGDPNRGQGLGLGLHIVKSNADLLGGVLSLESPPSGGARFTFRMPI